MNKKIKRLLSLFSVVCLIVQAMFTGSAFAGINNANINRLSGNDRYQTAIAVSKSGWKTSSYAILARGDDYADALCAGPLAKKLGAPILLTESDKLNASVLTELKRLNVQNVIIIGGTGAIKQNIEDTLKTNGIASIQRIYGSSRYETSVKIAEKLGSIDKVAVAAGNDFPDALSISAVAAKSGIPILLSQKDSLPQAVKLYLSGKQIGKSYIVGGTGVLSDGLKNELPNAVRLGGKDRFETNVLVMQEFSNQLKFGDMYVAIGEGPEGDEFADALSGATLAARTSSPIVLVGRDLPEATANFLKTKVSIASRVTALGGESAVHSSIVETIGSYISQIKVSANYDKAGTYGPEQGTETIHGNVILSTRDVVLQNTIIEGDLLLAESIGDGNVTLNNVTVKGATTVRGGGPHSVVMYNFNGQTVTVDAPDGNSVRLVAQGTTSIGSVEMVSDGKLEESNLTGTGFSTVVIPKGAAVTLAGDFAAVKIEAAGANVNVTSGSISTLNVAESASNSNIQVVSGAKVATLETSAPVTIAGDFNTVNVNAAQANISVTSGNIGTLNITESASNSNIEIKGGAKVNTLEASAPVAVTGTGAITTANIKSAGVSIAQTPATTNVNNNVTANVGGKDVTSGTPVTPPPSGGGGGGGGGSGKVTPPSDGGDVTPLIINGALGNIVANTTYTDSIPLVIALNIRGSESFANNLKDYISLGGTLSGMTKKSATVGDKVHNMAIVELTGTSGNSTSGAITIKAGGVIGCNYAINVVWPAPASKGTVAVSFDGGATYTPPKGNTVTFSGTIAFTPTDEGSGNWVEIKVTAPQGIVPGNNTDAMLVDWNNKISTYAGWSDVKGDAPGYTGGGDDYVYFAVRIHDINRAYSFAIKWNDTLTEIYTINFASTTRLEVYKTNLQNKINEAQGIYNGTEKDKNVETKRSDLSSAIDTAQGVYNTTAATDTTDASQITVDTAQSHLQQAIATFWDSYPTNIEATSGNIVAGTEYTNLIPLIIALNIRGTGNFADDLEKYITLDGTLSRDMTIKSAVVGKDVPNMAIIELTGTPRNDTDGTITIGAGGVIGCDDAIDAVWTAPASEGTVEVSLKGGESATTPIINGNTVTFGGTIAFNPAGEGSNLPAAGNWVGIKITAPAGITPGENTDAMLVNWNNEISTYAGWDNLKDADDDPGYMYLTVSIHDINSAYNLAIKWNDALTEIYTINFDPATKLEVYKTNLQNTIEEAQKIYDDTKDDENGNVTVTDKRKALLLAIGTAEEIYGSTAEVATTNAFQIEVDTAQSDLQQAIDTFWDSYPTNIESTSGDNINDMDITIPEEGVDSHSHEPIASIKITSDITTIGMKSEHENEVVGISEDIKHITVMYPLTVSGLKSGIESANGSSQTYVVTDSTGNAKGDDAVLAEGDQLQVTSQDGSASQTYAISVFGTVTIVVQSDGETPVQDLTVSLFNEDGSQSLDEDGNPITDIQLDADGQGSFFINAARYKYKISATGYVTNEGEFTFTLDPNPLIVTATLSPVN